VVGASAACVGTTVGKGRTAAATTATAGHGILELLMQCRRDIKAVIHSRHGHAT